MAEPVSAPADTGAQPKAALHYRMGGDHCGVCMHFSAVGPSKGTCPKVTPPDVDAADVCDEFGRVAREKPDAEVGGTMPSGTAAMAENLQKRGMISDKAMAGMRSRDY